MMKKRKRKRNDAGAKGRCHLDDTGAFKLGRNVIWILAAFVPFSMIQNFREEKTFDLHASPNNLVTIT